MEGNSISLIIIVVCIIMSAFFSATETAFSSLNRIRIKNMAEKGNKRAGLVLRMSENYDSLLSTILIGNNIVNIASASLATVLFVQMFGDEAGPSISTVVTTIVVLIFGEVSPKSIAKESPEKFAMFSAPILRFLVTILTPFNFLFAQWKKVLSFFFHSEEKNGITEEELLTMVEEAKEEGEIDEQESTLIRSAMEFTDMEVAEILTPRIDIAGVSVDSTKEEIKELLSETAFSRLPVYQDNIDHIVGVIYQKDFYNKVYNGKQEISDIMRNPLFVTKNKKIGTLLKELQQEKLHIAVVIDEYGGTVGIVTLEDILEELVGEIWDEHDEVEEEIQMISEDEYLVSGNTSVQKLFEQLSIKQQEEVVDYFTVNGWMMELVEGLPKEGEVLEIEGFEIQVIKMDKKRVEKIKLKKKEK